MHCVAPRMMTWTSSGGGMRTGDVFTIPRMRVTLCDRTVVAMAFGARRCPPTFQHSLRVCGSICIFGDGGEGAHPINEEDRQG